MKSLLKVISNFFSSGIKEHELHGNTSAQKLATMNALNRRKNTRIKYSHLGAVGDLPRIYYRGDELNVGNISTGGLLVIDDNEALGTSVNSIVYLEMKWADLDIEVKARVVSAQLQRRHIQFIDFNATAFVRISKLIKPGFLGSRFHIVNDDHSMLDAEELWVGPTGESLNFPKNNKHLEVANLCMANQTLVFEKNVRPFWKESGQVLDRETLNDVIVMISNFPNPSNLIKNLIEKLQLDFEAGKWKGTGTNG